MIRQEQCDKVCRILDGVLANRPTERDSLIIAVRKAFESLEQFGNSEPLPSAQPDDDRLERCRFEYINACKIVTHPTPDTTKKDIADAYAIVRALNPIFGEEGF